MAKTIVIDTEVKGVDQAVSDINKIDTAVDDVNKKSISPKFDSAKTEKSLENLQKKGEQIEKVGQGIAGGFALATGVVGAFGSELGFSSEEMEQAQAKASSFIGILVSIKPVIEGAKAGFQLFNKVLEKNPLILLATIIGGIIVSFLDMGAVVDVIKKGFQALGDVASAIFDGIVAGFEYAIEVGAGLVNLLTFGLVDASGALDTYKESVKEASAAEKKRIEAEKERIEILNKQIEASKEKIKSIEAEIDATDKSIKAVQEREAAQLKAYDEEIELLQAAGLSTKEAEKKKLETVRDSLNEQYRLQLEKYEKEKILLEENQKLLESYKEKGDPFFESIAQTEVGLSQVRVKLNEKTLDEIKGQEADNAHDIKVNNIKNQKEANDIARANNQLRIQQENEYLDEIARLQEENFESTLSAQAREERVVNDKYFALEEAAKNNAEELAIITEAKERELGVITKKYRDEENRLIAEANALRVQKENEYLDTIAALEEQNFENTLTDEEKEVRAINDKYFALEQAAKDNAEELKIINEAKNKELNDTDKKYRDEDKEHQRKVQDAKVQMVSDTLSTLSSLTELFGKKGEAGAKKAFQVNKAISIADAIIKTYQGANAIFATASANPKSVLFPAQPFIAAGLAIAGGFANVAKISATQFGGGASASGGGGDSGFGSGPSLPTVDTSSVAFQFPTAGDNNPQSNQQTFVSVTEINNVNNRVQVAEANATFG